MKISFYLKLSDTAKKKLIEKPELKNDKTFTVPIYYYLFVGGKHLRASTDISISICQWDEEKKKVNKKHLRYPELNEKLEDIRLKIENGIVFAKNKNKPITNDFLSDWLNGNINGDDKSFIEAYEEYLKFSKFSKSTHKIKISVMNNLVKFSENQNILLSFEAINLSFFDNFVKFLVDKGILNNSISIYISTLKAFMNYALQRELHNNREFQKKSFNIKNEPVEINSLTKQEFQQFFTYDFSKRKKLEEIRDSFFFSCVTGLRVSDLTNLKKDAINNNVISVNTIKTNSNVQVPVNDLANMILDKYNDNTKFKALPLKLNSNINTKLRTAAKEAGLNRQILKVRYMGAERIEKIIPLHEAITFHMSKKTFVSLLIECGVSREHICDITGNTYETIGRYINTDKEKSMQEVKNVINNQFFIDKNIMNKH